VAYKLELPPSLAGVYDIFRVSQLKKCLKAPVDVVLPEVAPLEMDLTYLRSRSWTKRVGSQDARRSSSTRFNGATIQKKKQHERINIFSILIIRISSYHSEGTCDCSLSLLNISPFQILGRDFVLGGGL
jgi:hypothetical protein